MMSSEKFTLMIIMVSCVEVRLGQLHTSATFWPIVPAQIINDECGAFGGTKIGRGN
jgi:hypothetical protein